MRYTVKASFPNAKDFEKVKDRPIKSVIERAVGNRCTVLEISDLPPIFVCTSTHSAESIQKIIGDTVPGLIFVTIKTLE
ncbi:hypothetical protein WHR41_09476 [Cladosporium halotolerans]|uniref:Uncharacterized protein n=1 Tax=Cladosporium halotolerans TaxID=1052096 RepID=A0AB34K9R1_9PEZI